MEGRVGSQANGRGTRVMGEAGPKGGSWLEWRDWTSGQWTYDEARKFHFPSNARRAERLTPGPLVEQERLGIHRERPCDGDA